MQFLPQEDFWIILFVPLPYTELFKTNTQHPTMENHSIKVIVKYEVGLMN